VSRVRVIRHGRCLDDFVVGETFTHPWEVTVDDGMRALFDASFQDASPIYASREGAQALGFRDRPLSPLLLFNLGVSFSVHDVSEQAIAHLAYLDVRFPEAVYAGDTLRAWSTVIEARPASDGARGIVRVQTVVANQHDAIACVLGRRVLVPAGHLDERAPPAPAHPGPASARDWPRLPPELRARAAALEGPGGFGGCRWEDFDVGDVLVHEVGRTVGESEHMQLTTLARNSHPLHFDEVYARGGGSFAGTRVVYGGLVLAWVLSLASRDTTGQALWEMGLDEGAHPGAVVAGDTLYAASKVLAKQQHDPGVGEITFRVVGLKNTPARALLEAGQDLFTPEHGKTSGKVDAKVVEITRRVLVRRRPARTTAAG
jgi:2-methylfumaryl-CoA hydratase